MNILQIFHPQYDENRQDWEFWRDTWEGGPEYVSKYLKTFSIREEVSDFETRKEISYNPSFAKSLIREIKNSIFQKMPEIVRKGGAESYQKAVDGDEWGVDRQGSSMNFFIGSKILPEMLVMRKVGIFLDKSPMNGDETLTEAATKRPYLYCYQAEEIRSWKKINHEEYSSVLLQETVESSDNEFNLPDAVVVRFRLLTLTDSGVLVTFFNEDGEETGNRLLDIPKIPFYVFEIEDSLMEDLAGYNKALLNLASADINYALKANFPFYTEQYDNIIDNKYAKGETQERKVGTVQGRAYPKNTERPAFIHPSSEPLKVSMEKQAQMKNEMRELLHLKVTEMGRRSSAESKEMDTRGLAAGLSYLGLQLEKGERKIASFWSMYEGEKQDALISYPTSYSLKTDIERLEESDKLEELKPAVPSATYNKEVSKMISRRVLGNQVSPDVISKIDKEIEDSIALNFDPEIIGKHVEIGLLAKKHAAEIMGYPEETVELSQEEHADRAKVIAISQSEGAGSRGINDLSPTPAIDGKEEKANAKADGKPTRGPGT